ncbi:conserved hypothetical protein (plasmid) [Methanohalobium evestigatum Z-7303]|uniref:Uncharacterized protein n=1 Tax=Methanohalobium evestigatum (strain ATCC BAA-1072 / DSM 3721 / NBRC 107634 / OCM 161 / Z-7303) TaxID=644295 RepID=D7EC12_METEZ|nr:conserved hypothetical protein [Methanohalobium evestigatum Z-7303]
MHIKPSKLSLGIFSLIFIVLLSSGLAVAQNTDNYIMNLSVNGNDFRFANHNESKTEGNWISLGGGEPVQLPTPIKFTYHGVNETSFSTDSKNVDIKLNVKNYTDYVIEYPFETHQMYTNTSGKNNVTYQFNGSKYFANKESKVVLIESDINSLIDILDKFKQGQIDSINDILSLDKVNSIETKDLDDNGDTNGEFENLDAGEYSVLIILNNEPVILSATAFDVLDYDSNVSTNSYITVGNNLKVDIELEDAPDTEYTYIAGIVKDNKYRADVRLETNGHKTGTDLLVNNEYIIDDFDLIDMSVSNLNKNDVKNKLVDVLGPDELSGKTMTVDSNQTSLNISTEGLPPGNYKLLVQASNQNDPIVAFEQKDITIKSEGIGAPATNPILMIGVLGIAIVLFMKRRFN